MNKLIAATVVVDCLLGSRAPHSRRPVIGSITRAPITIIRTIGCITVAKGYLPVGDRPGSKPTMMR